MLQNSARERDELTAGPGNRLSAQVRTGGALPDFSPGDSRGARVGRRAAVQRGRHLECLGADMAGAWRSASSRNCGDSRTGGFAEYRGIEVIQALSEFICDEFVCFGDDRGRNNCSRPLTLCGRARESQRPASVGYRGAAVHKTRRYQPRRTRSRVHGLGGQSPTCCRPTRLAPSPRICTPTCYAVCAR